MDRSDSISNSEEISSNSDENDSQQMENEELKQEMTTFDEQDLSLIPLPPEQNDDSTTEHEEGEDEPIKISIFSSGDGKYHFKYDDYTTEEHSSSPEDDEEEDDEEEDICFTSHDKKKYNKKSVKSSKLTKSTTETLYEIDLFCEVCNHDYKSLMSLNRHKRTRKHLNQVAKLNEVEKRTTKSVERDWNNYESYLSTYEIMPREVYNSIVQTLLEDSDNKMNNDHRLSVNNLRTNNAKRRDRNAYTYNVNQNNFYNVNEYNQAAQVNYTIPNYGMTTNGFVPILQPQYGQFSPFKCLICFEFFPTLPSLKAHIEEMSSNCSNIINSTHTELNIDESFI